MIANCIHGSVQLIVELMDNDHKNKLVAAYITLLKGIDGINKNQDIVDILNMQTGYNTRVSRLMDWRNGARSCPKMVALIMRRTLLQDVFDDDGADLLIKFLALD